jgi:uncharacterized membrane protein
MGFMIWATRSVHLFSAVVWIGGLLYLGGVLYPVFRHAGLTQSPVMVQIERRFLGFVWMGIWSLAITGVLLMLFSQRFQFGVLETPGEYLLLLKQVLFLGMIGVAIASGNSVRKMESIMVLASATDLEKQLLAQHERILLRRRVNILPGIGMLLISARMTLN